MRRPASKLLMRRASLLIVPLLATLASGCLGGNSANIGGSNGSSSASEPVPVLTGAADQVTPAALGGVLAWSQWFPDRGYDEYLRVRHGPTLRIGARVGRDGIQGGGTGGGISGTTLVYARVIDRKVPPRSQLGFYDIVTHSYSSPPAGWNPGRTYGFTDWRPSISGRFVLFGRSIVGGVLSIDDVELGDRTTGTLTQLASGANVVPGQVNGNYAVWEQCDENSASYCSVYRYDIAAKTTALISNRFSHGRFEYAPSVARTGTVYFIHSGRGCGAAATLVRQPLGGSDTVLVTFKQGVDVGSTYVDDTGDAPTVYYSQSSCGDGGRHGDLYRIAG
jgi:hypothetical protein